MIEAGIVAEHTAELMDVLAPLFARVEPRRTCRDYVQALLGGLPRANCWTLAEQAGHAGPARMQHLLERAVWDSEAALAAVGGFVVGKLADPAAVLVFDESGDEKRGVHTVGVARQYTGTVGKVTNCVNAVYCTYATTAGHALCDVRLYLHASWAGDQRRRAEVGVPEQVAFATKPQLAAAMLAAHLRRGTPFRWVAADAVYCATRRLVVSPAQPGGTRREVSGSDGLPGTERIRGQEHARKATVVFRRRSDALRDPRDMAKAGLPEP
jgi:SRSO17 transposase